jgi:YYY domain-containing protein
MTNSKYSWLYDILFVLILLMAGYLRLGGIEWGEGYHQHPDELFLSGVLDNLRAKTCDTPDLSIDACLPENRRWMTPLEYLDSAKSTLNPFNRGFGFFVYGNLPLTVTRVLMEATGNDDLGASKFFSRQMSAIADLFAIFFLYLLVSRLYGRKVGVLAAAFSSLAVMQIQQSHFFTVDLFVNTFLFLTLLFAVGILEWGKEKVSTEEVNNEEQETSNEEVSNEKQEMSNEELATHPSLLVTQILKHPLFYLSIGFGFALGMAMASKINAAVMAFVLPLAFFIRWLIYDRSKKLSVDYWILVTSFLVAGGLATIISFRIFQPYAFDGLLLSEQWIKGISEQRLQATGKADLPWNLQWARRSHLYSFENLTVWGLGLPLGILAWAGFLFMGWRILKGEYHHLLLWGWTAFYFGWQSMQFNPTMRYQLPVYPLLAMMAAWVLFEIPRMTADRRRQTIVGGLSSAVGLIVLTLTAIWAFAFQSIYLRPEPRMTASRWLFQNAPSAVNVFIETDGGLVRQPLPFPSAFPVTAGTPYSLQFTAQNDGAITEVTFGYARDDAGLPAPINLTLTSAAQPDLVLGRASTMLDTTQTANPRGVPLTFTFDKVIPILKDQQYTLAIETLGQVLYIEGAAIVNETDYDWGLPFRIDGYDPYGGMYSNDDLVLQVYWGEDANKLTRYLDVLNKADYIVIPTNHQYAQITRLPERYPMTTLYYRDLIGCPAGEDIIECYRLAQPGTYEGRLGFELTAVFESYPTLGPIVINDQRAEEAFTFYDHPKVLIFKKSADFDSNQLRAVLSSVDLTQVVPLTPTQFSDFKTLMLPESKLATQRAGGTWSDLFDYDWLHNKYPVLGMLFWYAFIFLLGLFAYPIARLALPGLRQYAYPLGRIVGLVLLAWLAWIGGSVGVPYTRISIGVAFALVVLAGVGLWMRRKEEFKEDWDSNRRFFVMAEIVFLSFFLIDLLIRVGNPDMWHPSKGGERPMDFSYFNAVLKSTSFPPYDPWYAGGYINYYYYGFVLAGTPVKLLGIVPSIAYNFILPTWFALVAVGAFTVGYASVERSKLNVESEQPSIFNLQLITGLAGSLLTIFLGNLGTIQMIFNAFQRVVAPGGSVPAETGFFQRWAWAFQGLWKVITEGVLLPIGRGDWYWNPSRVIPPGPGNEITEFPLFTFLYSDLHAHMLVMPLALFIIAWALAFVRARAQLTRGEWIASFGMGALMIGALKPTNTWDLYTYYLLAAIAVAYTLVRYFDWKDYFNLPAWVGKTGLAIGAAALLYALGSLFYLPFSQWFGQAYNSVSLWDATRTPFSSYFTQWGLFLFIITAWLIWETREWMAATPLSHLKRLRPYVILIEIALAGLIALLVFFLVEKATVGLFALPLAFWALLLILRPDLPDTKRFILFLTGTALTITIAVEFIALVGDIGRMNTIFKLYLQAWMMFAVSAAAAFGWLLPVFSQWRLKWRITYQAGVYILLACAFMFTLTASTDKISDRLNTEAPHSFDGMEFMAHSQHWDGQIMDLSEDYRAIRWMQDNIEGSPVIVEANCTEYRWCTRFTIYTGLPGVVGWNWHQRQQRGIFAPQVQERVNEVGAFYTTLDLQATLAFLKKYDVKYFVVGQLERNVYPALPDVPDGLSKFTELEGAYWEVVYQDLNTTIYKVKP